MAYVQRVATFNPYARPAKGSRVIVDDDYSDDESPYDASSSLLGRTHSENANWSFSLARLRETRRRPFLASGVAITIFGILVILSCAISILGFYRQWALVGASQAAIGVVGLATTGAVVAFTIFHLWALSAFSNDSTATGAVRFTDFLQKVSLGCVGASVIATLRLWQNDPAALAALANGSIARMFITPTRAWMLGASATQAILLLLVIIIGASVPYRKAAYIHAAAVRTFALAAMFCGVAATALALISVFAHPTRYYDSVPVWASLAAGVSGALCCLGLAVSATQARRASSVSSFWFPLLLIAAVGSAAAGALLYTRVVPDLGAPVVRSDALFTAAVLCMGVAACQVLASLMLAMWKLGEYAGEPKRVARAHEMDYYPTQL